MARKAENTAARAVEDQRSQTERDNEEAMRRMDNSRPTPTQQENDLAKVGALPLDAAKEDHGGEDPQVALERNALARVGGAFPYATRDAAAGPSESARTSGRGAKE